MAVRPNKKASYHLSYSFIVSACLAGISCTYNGKNKLNKKIMKLVDKGIALPVCPELLGGSSVPRASCEIVAGDGGGVLDKKAKVFTRTGNDITPLLVRGAWQTLKIARKHGIKNAILKSKSPSCGCGNIYDGTFRGILRKGDGVTAALLKRRGIKVFKEKDGISWPVRSISQK